MNSVFKVIWNHTLQRWDVTSEVSVAYKKSKQNRIRTRMASVLSSALILGSVAFANENIAVKGGDIYSIKDKAEWTMGNITVDGFKIEEVPPAEGSSDEPKKIEKPSTAEISNIKKLTTGDIVATDKGKVDLINVDKGTLGNITLESGGHFEVKGTQAPDKYSKDRYSNIRTGDITIRDGGKFTAERYSKIEADNIHVTGKDSHMQIGVDKKPDPNPNITTPVNIYEYSTSLKAKEINIDNGAILAVGRSAVDMQDYEAKLRIETDKLVVGPASFIEKTIEGSSTEKPKESVETVLDLTGAISRSGSSILDMTSIELIEISGGKVKGLDDTSAKIKVKDLTFKNIAGSHLKANDIRVSGNLLFEVGLDPVSGKDNFMKKTGTPEKLSILDIKYLDLGTNSKGVFVADKLSITEGNIATKTMPEIIKSSYGNKDQSISINNKGALDFKGNQDFEFELVDGNPELVLSESNLKKEGEVDSVLTILTKVSVKEKGKLSGNGFIDNLLTLSGGDLYVGNAGTNNAGTGHLAVKDLKIENDYGFANLHFGFSAHQADRLTILNSAHGYGAVYIYPQGQVKELATSEGLLLVDASTIPELNEDKKPANTLDLQLANRVAIGLYEYELVKRENVEGANGAGAQWYLTYDKNEIAPQANAYLANLAVSNKMFTLSYQDREYIEDGEGMWLNIKNSYNKFKGNHTDRIESKINYFVLRVGNDLVDEDDYSAGWLASYGAASGDSKNRYENRTADSKVHGFSVGGYGTYFFDQDKNTYLDASLQYVRTSNKVEGDDKPTENYKADGFVASLELGTDIEFARDWSFVPSTQVTWSDVKAKKHRAEDGTNYSSNRGNLEWRLGALIKAKESFMDGMITPYVGANYILNSNAPEVKVEYAGMENDVALAGSKSIYQLIMGTDVKFSKDLHLSGELSHTMGQDKYRDTKVKVNMRYIY
ncbi:autotransporter outer membrane beta-barrel domain-containing protein [Ignatzschineria larvae DSM 13226]|uniref:Autotransporter outer membrane beta-barrel domain-containing protein n=1 Tax=Ignatzschineria larvae DSM 13226 TaxID=1111732 RepID=A0ABZ3C168_9GAMM